MTKLSPQPRVKLSRLRDIGWAYWDPIGLLGPEGLHPGKWDDDANLPFADEYDSYLVSAASQLRRNVPREQVVDYLVRAETQDMCLPKTPTAQARAEAVVAAILADRELWTWPDEQGRFG
ncbi:hypothetical protein Q0601_10600 [Paracoccus onubensis]|uniref:hypothetical protein n=1 Tax=Paracoccus onubensis TaxID=1675788 RepID=UPI00273128D7|nr:hypothetical protein [Paracoccus onubensis]MDP0927623.1 hypothetical protein [Paracoccus onubensis]